MHYGYKIIDIDRHVLEPVEMWPNYMPSSAHRYLPYVETTELEGGLGRPSLPLMCADGRSIWADLSEGARLELGEVAHRRARQLAQSTSPRGQLEDMNQGGIDFSVLLPTYAAYLIHDDETERDVSRTYAVAYNRWMTDFVAADPGRLCAALAISQHEPAATMVDDLEAALKRRPAPVFLRPNPIRGRTLGDPSYARFWAACSANDVPILLHEGSHARVATAGRGRFHSRFAQHACSHPMEAMMAFLALLEGGVLERHPKLRIGFLEAGCTWLPHWLWRLDHLEYRNLRGELAEQVTMPPSAYFRRQCWIALEAHEPQLRSTMELVGGDRFVVGSDFPHLDHEDDEIASALIGYGDLSPESLRTVLWDNPNRLLGRFGPLSGGGGA